LALGASASCASGGSSRVAADTGAIVVIESGRLQGIAHAEYREYLGIPYAAPPVGEFRWASPQPVAAWSGVRSATTPGTECPQPGGVPGTTASTVEDCLYLAVTTPVVRHGDALRPVMVWLHGGGFIAGSGSVFDPHRLAMRGNVIVVSVNYRLGALGFLSYPGLEGSGAFGLEDQQAALRWVQRNALAFGGDPNNVTLFGESAGGMSTCAQLTSPAADGLFHRVIIQSGSCLLNWPYGIFVPGYAVDSVYAPLEQAEQIGLATAAQLGCAEPDQALTCLRTLPVESLNAVAFMFGQPAYGAPALPEDPVRLLRQNRVPRIPVMSGGTRDEHRLFSVMREAQSPLTEEAYSQSMRDAFGEAAAARVLEHYPVGDQPPILAWAAVASDRSWACPTQWGNELIAARTTVFAYDFADRNAPTGGLDRGAAFPLGAAHFFEVPYLLDTRGEAGEPWPAPQQALADLMIQYWSNFARTGDPNGAGLPRRPS
jgi:para-nitrobenzyl esterase